MKTWEKALFAVAVAYLLWEIWETGRCPLCGESSTHTHSSREVQRAGLAGHPGFRRTKRR